jgi:hypothetical protein
MLPPSLGSQPLAAERASRDSFLSGIPWTQIGGAALAGIVKNHAGQSTSTASGSIFREGTNIDILGQEEAKRQGLIPNGRKRRRRRKLLTCSDKADIAFLYGQLGGGQLGRAAISSLLSRRCS